MRINISPSPSGLVAAAVTGMAASVLATTPALVWLAARAARAENRAGRDPLTGIAHRHTGRVRFSRSATPQDLLLLDLNGFKDVNDTLGHDAGDQVIQAVASRLDLWARLHGALAARLGGDEFLVLQRHHDNDTVQATAGVLHDLVAMPVTVTVGNAVVPLQPSASVGVSLPGHGRTWSARLRTADIALYHAKRSRPPIVVYTPGMTMPTTGPGLRLRDLATGSGDGHG